MLFDAIDCMALHHRRAAGAAPAGFGLAHRIEASRCRLREAGLVRRAAVTVAVSGRDLEALGAGAAGRVVPVAAGERARRAGTSSEPVVLLSGNLGYRPTVRAARWFADRVWPGLRAAVPGATWVLAGARPAPAVRRLGSLPGVEVHGDVDDMAPHLGRARLAIAPMTSGSGVPLKILEALAAGVPVIAEPWSAAGLADPGAVVEAEGDDAWLAAAVELLTDDAAAERRRERGIELWRNHYRPERVREEIRGVVEAAWATGGR
jgi:glycosyltransferase involved in cell wall biosynthesis